MAGAGGGGGGGDTIPVSTIVAFAGDISTIPNGWLLCDGSLKSKVTFAALFTALGTKYGAGDASNFNLPDFRSKFPRGAPAATEGGGVGGDDTVTLTAAQSGLPSHGHGITDPGHFHTTGAALSVGTTFTVALAIAATTNINTGSKVTGITVNNAASAPASSSHENKPPFQNIQYIIKT